MPVCSILTNARAKARLMASVAAAMVGAAAAPASAYTLTTLYTFSGTNTDGAFPLPVTVDAEGNIFGTAQFSNEYLTTHAAPNYEPAGKVNGSGVIFELTVKGKFNALHRFGPTPQASYTVSPLGNYPYNPLLLPNGTIYAAPELGGPNADGTVIEIPKSGRLYTKAMLVHAFDDNEAYYPSPGPELDPHGNIVGFTASFDVYRITPSGDYSFASVPAPSTGRFAFDPAGNIFYTGVNINSSNGAIFELAPDNTATVLYQFTGGANGYLYSQGDDVVRDASGNLYGTALGGNNCGNQIGCGIVWEFSAQGQYKILYSFTGGTDGQDPLAVYPDANGNVFGTTYGDDSTGAGQNLFEITAEGDFKVLYQFPMVAGSTPLISGPPDAAGALIGVFTDFAAANIAALSGTSATIPSGSIFKLTP